MHRRDGCDDNGSALRRTISQRLTGTGWSEELVALAGVAVLAAALGWTVVHFDGFGRDARSAALVTAGGIACAAVIAAGPVACLATVSTLSVAGLLPVIGRFGGVDVTLADLFYVALVAWWAVLAVQRGQGTRPAPQARIAFGQGVAIAFLAYAGLTLLKVATSDPGGLTNALISWLRLVQSASLAWLAASVIETRRDLRLLVGAVTLGALIAIVVALAEGGDLTARATGTLTSPDALGLVSGFALMIGAFGGLTSDARARILLVAAGLVGLLLAKSVAAFVATGFALALGLVLASTAPAKAAQRARQTVLTFALAGVAVFGVLQFLRPEVVPGSARFTQSSAYARIVLGTAGLEIFADNPVIGAGWRESNSPRLMSDRAVNLELRQLYPDANPVFYPDVTPTSAHDTYIQILADVGLVGFLLFIAMILAVGARVRALLRRLGRGHELGPLAWSMSLCLLLALIWLNDNPLYGGQPEVVVPAVFAGALAAVWRMDFARQPAGPRARPALDPPHLPR